MTITVDLPDQQAAVLSMQAAAQDVSLEDWVRKIATDPHQIASPIDW